MDDEGDFKKARGFLLTYSALVLALWYFGADLTQFKLMGNEIKLHQRTESVWLVLAALNAYFWFRFYQRLPTDGLYLDTAMDKLYDASLLQLAMRLNRRKLDEKVATEFVSRDTPTQEFKIYAYRSKITQRPERAKDRDPNAPTIPSSYFNLIKYRVRVVLIADHRYIYNTKWADSPAPTFYECYLDVYLTWPLKAITIIRGAFITPWFTDHVMPLVLGGISTGFALWKWCDMNFFTTTLPHLAQSCAGVTH